MSRHSERISAAIAAIPKSRFPQLCGDGLRPSLPRNHRFPPFRIIPVEAETAVDFLELLRPTRSATMSVSQLKPWVEMFGQKRGLSTYVSKGAIILAADVLGLVIRTDTYQRSIDARIGVSKVSLAELLRGSWRQARND